MQLSWYGAGPALTTPRGKPISTELGMAVSEMFLEKAAPSGAQGHSWLQRVQGQETPSHPLKAEKRK